MLDLPPDMDGKLFQRVKISFLSLEWNIPMESVPFTHTGHPTVGPTLEPFPFIYCKKNILRMLISLMNTN